MKKYIVFWLLLLATQISAQSWISSEKTYFYAGTGLDVRNAVFGGTVNPSAYDGIFSLGYRNEHFSFEAYYETFQAINYASSGFNVGYVYRPGKKLIPVTDLSISIIQRPWKSFPSLAINNRLEFHFSRFFIYARGESRWRTDYDFFQISVYGGINFKFGFEY